MPRLELIVGCMFAGKTTELLRRLRDAAAAGHSVIALKPASDTRSLALATHTGDHFPASAIASADALAAAAGDAAVIGIDEAHFFGESIVPPCLALSDRRVILAGVRLDHFGRPFEPFATLESRATDITILHAPCSICGKPAIHSQRMTPSTARIAVGGAESYQPRCESCFTPST